MNLCCHTWEWTLVILRETTDQQEIWIREKQRTKVMEGNPVPLEDYVLGSTDH